MIPTIRSIVRRDLLVVFLIALFAGGGGFYVLLEQTALDNAEQQARMVLASAMSLRDYTNDRIVPKLMAAQRAQFDEETVPSFAAQSVFRTISNGDNAYSYREAALDPTAPADRAGPFEVDLIRQFRSDNSLAERRGMLDENGFRFFYLARPIRITDAACLICHDTPARAPKTMLAKYGSENGFGWKLNAIVGVQVVTVPITREFRATFELVTILLGGLALIFAVAYFALSAAMDRAVVVPLAHLAHAAEAASRSGDIAPTLPKSGAREIRMLAEAIQLLRVSLAKALAQLGLQAPGSKTDGTDE